MDPAFGRAVRSVIGIGGKTPNRTDIDNRGTLFPGNHRLRLLFYCPGDCSFRGVTTVDGNICAGDVQTLITAQKRD